MTVKQLARSQLPHASKIGTGAHDPSCGQSGYRDHDRRTDPHRDRSHHAIPRPPPTPGSHGPPPIPHLPRITYPANLTTTLSTNTRRLSRSAHPPPPPQPQAWPTASNPTPRSPPSSPAATSMARTSHRPRPLALGVWRPRLISSAPTGIGGQGGLSGRVSAGSLIA
jgi:hypothetical protein